MQLLVEEAVYERLELHERRARAEHGDITSTDYTHAVPVEQRPVIGGELDGPEFQQARDWLNR